ncbi:hypothetical protein ES703_13370 [subsurface metagenome]
MLSMSKGMISIDLVVALKKANEYSAYQKVAVMGGDP